MMDESAQSFKKNRRPAQRQSSVSAIVTTYNRADYLQVALESLLAQTIAVDEIIVVNDASTDRTADVLKAYGDKVRALHQPQNQGKPAGLNRAIPEALGQYIWLFDDDDAALPHAIEAHLDFLEENPEIDFSYSDKYIFTGAGDIWQRGAWRISRLPEIKPEELLIRTMLSMNTLFQGMLVPARCYAKAGPFDESLKRCEDHEMLLRLARYFRGANIGQPTFVYREHAGNRGAGINAHAGGQRFRVMMAYKKDIFRNMRERYPLACYLPRKTDSGLDDAGKSRALLQRSCVMFRHGLIEEALDDLDAALGLYTQYASNTDWMPYILSQSVDVEPWIWPNWPRDLQRLARLINRYNLPSGNRSVLRGLYWNASREWRKRSVRPALMSSYMLAYFGARSAIDRLRRAPLN